MSGPVRPGAAAIGVSPSPARPMIMKPIFAACSRARFRFVAIAIGSRAAAPADVFHAAAVIDAERRDGITTPVAPKAAAERTMAPRLRGSVTPSRATTMPSVSNASASTSSTSAYS